MPTFEPAERSPIAQQSPWERYFSFIAGGVCPCCKATAIQSLAHELTQWQVVVECSGCPWKLADAVRRDDSKIEDGLERATASKCVDQDFLAVWLTVQLEGELLKQRQQALIDALLADSRLIPGLLSAKLLKLRGRHTTWDSIAKVLDPELLRSLRTRWHPTIEKTAVVHKANQSSSVRRFVGDRLESSVKTIIGQSALFEHLILRSRQTFFRRRQLQMVALLEHGAHVEPGPLFVAVQQHESPDLYPPKLFKLVDKSIAAAIEALSPTVERFHLFITAGTEQSIKRRARLIV